MKELKDIFQIIEKEKIILEETIIRYNDTEGIYFNIPGTLPTIFIDKSIINDRCKYISILGEELGHHFTTFQNLPKKSKTYSEKLQKNKKENKAKSWAANFLISDEDFVHALYDCISAPCDICDYFNITDEILKFKILSIIHDEVKYNNIKNNFREKEIPYETCCI